MNGTSWVSFSHLTKQETTSGLHSDKLYLLYTKWGITSEYWDVACKYPPGQEVRIQTSFLIKQILSTLKVPFMRILILDVSTI